MRAARNKPEIKKKSGMRNGRAQSMNPCSEVLVPIVLSTPKVECIMTTRTMQMPLATSIQSSRPVASSRDILQYHRSFVQFHDGDTRKLSMMHPGVRLRDRRLVNERQAHTRR